MVNKCHEIPVLQLVQAKTEIPPAPNLRLTKKYRLYG